MKTDVDSCLKEIGDWYLKNRRSMTEAELGPILLKHCENEAEVRKFVSFLQTEPGQTRFKIHLKERKEASGEYDVPFAQKLHGEMMKELKEPSYLAEKTPQQVWDEWTSGERRNALLGMGYKFDGDPSWSHFSELSPELQRQVADYMVRVFPGKIKPSYLKEKYVLIKSGAHIGSVVEVESWEKEKADYIKRGKTPPEVEYLPPEKPSYLKEAAKELKIKLTPKQVDVIHFRFLDVGYEWVKLEGPRDNSDLIIPPERVKEALSILDSACDITRDWHDPAGVAEHRATCALYERVKEALQPSYLKEATVLETECQLISPQYYDVLTWFNVPVPDYSFAIEPEVKERKIDEVLQKLKDGVSRIHESSIFREFLTTMAKFWEYSFGNQILIMLQRPGATRVAGFMTWKELGRHVKFGEKGIAILAPCLPPRILRCPLCEKTFTESDLRRHLSEVHQRTDVSSLIREAREETVGVPTPTYFKVVNVFDVSQTEGKPLPEIAVPVLSGAFSRELYDKLMALASKQSLTVSFEPRPEQDPQIKGMLLGKHIWVKGDEPEAQRLKTLGHELAHYFTEAVYLIPRADAEVIAESVSFVVCAHSGFDTGTRSFSYVAIWSQDKKVLERNLASIRRISGRMIDELG